jgi:hypothetical protein
MICLQPPTLHQNLIFADISIITSYPDVYHLQNYLNDIFCHWLEELVDGQQHSRRKQTLNTLPVNLRSACSVMRATTSFMKIPKKGLVSLFPLHHDIPNNFPEKFSDTKDVYASYVRVCIQPVPLEDNIHIHAHINTHTKLNIRKTISGG